VQARQIIAASSPAPSFVALAGEVQLNDNRSVVAGRLKPFKAGELHEGRVWRWRPRLERFYGRDDIQRLLQDLQTEMGLTRLADADFIIDVGFGVANRDGYEAVIEPLEQALRELGVRNLAIGGSRKVTEELRLLPGDRQIGQSGISVQPKVLLAIGVSGAPQHLDYIGSQATILAFNRDPEAPIMTLGRRKPRPRVYPVVGDLFETVPALIAALRQAGERAEQGATIAD
jgi:electron transfer flavoprotein alpha subunit